MTSEEIDDLTERLTALAGQPPAAQIVSLDEVYRTLHAEFEALGEAGSAAGGGTASAARPATPPG